MKATAHVIHQCYNSMSVPAHVYDLRVPTLLAIHGPGRRMIKTKLEAGKSG